jgi:hypothetical protein
MPDLCQSFKDLSHWTWAILRDGHSYKLSIGETSLTDILLLTLSGRHPQHMICRKRPDEHVTGADCDLLFFSPGRYFGIRVQAKRLYRRGSSWHYPSLDAAQAQALIRSSRRSRLGALYCFYNWWHPPDSRKPNPANFGCAIASPTRVLESMLTVRGRHWHKTLDRHLPNMRPWHKLVCPADVSLPDRVRRALESLPPPPPIRDPPNSIRRLLQSRNARQLAAATKSYFERSENENVRGFALISESDLSEIDASFK